MVLPCAVIFFSKLHGCYWFGRDRGSPARWASGSQNCLIGTGSSGLGSLKVVPTASG